jgi:hypothetical protein
MESAVAKETFDGIEEGVRSAKERFDPILPVTQHVMNLQS